MNRVVWALSEKGQARDMNFFLDPIGAEPSNPRRTFPPNPIILFPLPALFLSTHELKNRI